MTSPRSRKAWILVPALVMAAASALAYLDLIPSALFRSPWDKAMHATLYGALAFCAVPWVPRRWTAAALWAPLLLGALDECLQSLSPVRSADVYDFAADAAGIVLAYTAARRIV